jgi:soluble lytic murein transglycosylase-like protein
LKNRRPVILASVALALALLLIPILIVRRPVQRRRLFPQIAPAATPTPAPANPREEVPPINQWSAQFQAMEAANRWDELAALLSTIEAKDAAAYAANELGYLHARALIESNQPGAAARRLEPYLASTSPFRDLALYHSAEIADLRHEPEAASRARQTLLAEHSGCSWCDEARDDELSYLAGHGTPAQRIAFAMKLYPRVSTAGRRDLDAEIATSLLKSGRSAEAVGRALQLLAGGTMDDAADKVAGLIDRPAVIRSMTPEQLVTLGDTMRNHRHFDRAVTLLTAALGRLPARRDELQFAIGRSYFGSENYTAALQWYLRDAGSTADPKTKATSLFHASRAAQLMGNDQAAETYMTAAIAIPGHYPATTSALIQRLRTRLHEKRMAEAAGDLALLSKIGGRDHDVVEGQIAYASTLIAQQQEMAAVKTLDSIPRALFDQYDPSEIAYWKGRAEERSGLHAALASYLQVLRSAVPTHFAYLARQRLEAPSLRSGLARELQIRDVEVVKLSRGAMWDAARQVETDRVLLSPAVDRRQLEILAAIYRRLPRYRAILDIRPMELPHFPLTRAAASARPIADRGPLLMALGLFDEATDEVIRRYPLSAPATALTQSLALNRGGASKQSIYAIEVLMKSVPADFVPELLPRQVQELLYPRYFDSFIEEDSKKFGADPTLVLSIMREESRFNPRAKSEAAARGLLQFIITTATQIGRDVGLVDVSADELYDPRVIIRLGAKYVGDLLKLFDSDHYKAAASYNAGPNQVALWSRLAPAPGHDYFIAAINFDETKNYVRKVMNSYARYSQIYGNANAAGGVHAEP